MSTTPSIWHYIADADWIVKSVMLILLAASIASWTLIFQRFNALKQIKKEMYYFAREFNSGLSFSDLLSRMGSRVYGMTAIFRAGYKEYEHLVDTMANNLEWIDGVKRAMNIAQQEQMEKLEENISFLATVGSTSPYIGLFGTVWGIMSAFRALGSVQQASIAMVAPGISEALIATAIGLFAAIPAVIAYNRFSTQLVKIDERYHRFQDELITRLHRLS